MLQIIKGRSAHESSNTKFFEPAKSEEKNASSKRLTKPLE